MEKPEIHEPPRRASTAAAGYMQRLRHDDDHPDVLESALETVVIEEVNHSAVQLFGGHDARDLLGPVAPYWRSGAQTFRNIFEARYRGEQEYQEDTKLTTVDGRVVEGLFTFVFSTPHTQGAGHRRQHLRRRHGEDQGAGNAAARRPISRMRSASLCWAS